MNSIEQIDRAELQTLALQFSLTELEIETANLILAGRAAFPLQNYCQPVREFVAFVREKQTEQTEKPFAQFT
jgi:hypothetical protein